MAYDIVVPRLGWSMDEGTFAEWLKQDGDQVNAGDMLFILEGEKAAQEIESFDSGILRIPPQGPQPGDTVAVGQLLGYLVEEGEEPPFENISVGKATTKSSSDQESKPPQKDSNVSAGPAIRRLARDLNVDLTALQGTGPAGRITQEDVRAASKAPANLPATATPMGGKRSTSSPRARRIARELGLDPTTVTGTGRGGRVRERDIRAAAAQAGKTTAPATSSLASLSGKTIPITPIRRTIAERMLAGIHQAAPVTLTTKVNATNLVNLRVQFKAADLGSQTPSFTDLIVKLSAVALTEHPLLSAQWTENGIVVPERINVAFAVDTAAGLLAPVIEDVGAKTIRQIATDAQALIEAANASTLTAEQMRNGCFTVSNLGGFGVDAFTPIINLPQAAILGVGRIAKEPVVVDNQIVIQEVMALSLTFDHRIVDGAPAARFLDQLRSCIEQPSPWLMG
ncbi:MAG: 2-oxo acid dehydrogenase subunit E2 [Pirellulaceae bacterium]|nr:2-oxo acid dehydrogenase subunit E2 [Pirellulaceae bacterium]